MPITTTTPGACSSSPIPLTPHSACGSARPVSLPVPRSHARARAPKRLSQRQCSYTGLGLHMSVSSPTPATLTFRADLIGKVLLILTQSIVHPAFVWFVLIQRPSQRCHPMAMGITPEIRVPVVRALVLCLKIANLVGQLAPASRQQGIPSFHAPCGFRLHSLRWCLARLRLRLCGGPRDFIVRLVRHLSEP